MYILITVPEKYRRRKRSGNDNKLNSLLHLTKPYLSAFTYRSYTSNENQVEFWFFFGCCLFV